jgi:hypothetical protein
VKHSALVLGLVLGVVAPVEAVEPLSKISHLLAAHSRLCADFTQSKTLRVLTRPLVSQGRLVFRADKGVLWRVRTPFPTQVLIKQDALINWDYDGRPVRIGFEQSPIFGTLSRVFMAFFTGDLTRLSDAFRIESTMSMPNWQVSLTPRNKAFAAIIAHVRADGSQFVDALRITEGNGDQTTITFSNMTALSCRLDDAEKAYFAH